MGGQPVWLVSISRRDHSTQKLIPTGRWDEVQKRRAIDLMKKVLGPLGDKSKERHFRMNATLCIHRALSADEVAQLPDEFTCAPALDIAGGPVAILWESEEGAISTRPCANPEHMILDPKQP